MRTALLGAVLLACALPAACGEGAGRTGTADPERETTYSVHGLTVQLSPGWRPARVRLTPELLDPREVLTVATFPLRYRPTRCAQVPGSALQDLGRNGGLITVQERGVELTGAPPPFPPRPAAFGPQLDRPSEARACLPHARFQDHRFAFADGDRRFHVEVAFGPDASANTKRQAWAILDSLRVDGTVRPDWPATG
jgi:hypothetical protein